MLRAIFFLDCDFCHQPHSDIRSVADTDGIRGFIPGELEESAFNDGWCLCLIEDTGQYNIMCGSCHAEQSMDTDYDCGDENIEF
jgi:hypothetical protein